MLPERPHTECFCCTCVNTSVEMKAISLMPSRSCPVHGDEPVSCPVHVKVAA